VDAGKSPFSVTRGFRFPSMLQGFCSNSYRRLLKNERVQKTTVNCSLWDDEWSTSRTLVIGIMNLIVPANLHFFILRAKR